MKSKLKILIAADIYKPQSGGPATYVWKLKEYFKSKTDVVFFVVSQNPEGLKEKTDNDVFHVKFKNKVLRYINYFYLLLKLSRKVDVIYAMGPVNAGLPALLVSKLSRKKLVIKVVGDYAWEQAKIKYNCQLSILDFQKQQIKNFFINLLKKIEKLTVKNANLVITPSNFLANIVKKWSAKNIKVIYNGVEFKKINKERFKVKTILSVSRLVKWKNIDILIKAVKNLNIKQDWQLIIVGSGPEELNLKKIASDNNKIKFLGNLDNKQVLEYMSQAHLLVLLSEYEGLSHVILEALSQKLPVLALNVGGNPELIKNNVNGFLLNNLDVKEVKSKIELVLNTNNLNPELAGDFYEQNMLDKTYQILKELL